jgi:LysM repeat protein
MRSFRIALLIVSIISMMLPTAVFAEDIVHTVQPGENLYRIGLKYGVSWQSIMTANGLSSTNIYTGQQLKIPGQATSPVEAPANSTPAPVTQPEASVVETTVPSTYIVVRGDTLGSIAQRFGTTISTLVSLNHLTNPNRIYYGQSLMLNTDGVTIAETAPVVIAAPTVAAVKEIHVDISEQRMRVYENGALIWDWVTSTGERGRETMPGNFSVLNKIPNAYGATWNLWMPNWLGIYWAGYLQNGIHSLPILSDGSKLWAGFLGTPVSFGCVILDDTNSLLLYNWAEVGTPVIITY